MERIKATEFFIILSPKDINDALGYVPASRGQVFSTFRGLSPITINEGTSGYEWDGGETEATITINTTGGIGTLTYTLGTESNTTGVFVVTSAGEYTVVVTDEVDGEESITINVEAPL